ncbi:MAG: UDP-N-acetylglucosamine--N-acetylmuramyl-(pentapeptide) pyrophosphoryl-undecaprenol N-acetylglucosamine transferase, partial [Planctomycetota bacterium]
MTKPLAVVVAGGGTGGHLYPALAILEHLDAYALFLPSERAIDERVLSAAGVERRPLKAKPFSTKPIGLLKFMASWAPSVRAARETIRELQASGHRVVMLATGGFVAAPAVQAARVERVPVVLINLDDPPGKANRVVAKHARTVLSAAGHDEAMRRNWIPIPPIVRAAARAPGEPAECRQQIGLDPDRPTLFATGGSQGARTLNDVVLTLAERGDLEGWQVVHQSGEDDQERVEGRYRELGVPSVVRGLIDDVGGAWGAADLAIARAGAGAVAEVWANAVPTAFLPYPFHADEHQRRNAEPLVQAGGAVVVRDHKDAQSTLAAAGDTFTHLFRDPGRRASLQA